MRQVRGHFNGSVVVLDEPAPVAGNVEVVVQFPDVEAGDAEQSEPDLRWHWNNARSIYLQHAGTVSDEILRQRGRFDVTPSGLPVNMPSDEEWKKRAERISRILRAWQDEEPSDDLATWEELKAGLDANPLQFGEIRLDE